MTDSLPGCPAVLLGRMELEKEIRTGGSRALV